MGSEWIREEWNKLDEGLQLGYIIYVANACAPGYICRILFIPGNNE